MTPDPEYLKRLLTGFREAARPTTDIQELEASGLSYQDDPNFIFHLLLLRDQGFVTDDDDRSLGYVRSVDGFVSWSVIPLRLTAQGHEFAEVMSNNKVITEIKKNWVGASISTMFQVGATIIKAEITKYGVHLP